MLYPLLFSASPALVASARSISQSSHTRSPHVLCPISQADQSNPLHTASRTELDVVKVLIAQEHAWNAGDIETYVKGYLDSPDTVFMDKQVTRGYQNILEDYKHNYLTRSSMGTLAYSELEVHAVSETVAICTGKYHLDRSRKTAAPPSTFSPRPPEDPRRAGRSSSITPPERPRSQRSDRDPHTVIYLFSFALNSSSTRLISASVSC